MKHLKFFGLVSLVAFTLAACATNTLPAASIDTAIAASDTTKSTTGIQTWTLSKKARGACTSGLDTNGITRTTLEGTIGTDKSISVVQRVFNEQGQETERRESKIDANGKVVSGTVAALALRPLLAASVTQITQVLSSDLIASIDPSGELVFVGGTKTPCEKATNQLNRALAKNQMAADAAAACRATKGFASGPGKPDPCAAEVAALDTTGNELVVASNKFNMTCLGL